MQTLERKDRMLPRTSGRGKSHGFEKKRRVTLSLLAAPNMVTGKVLCMTAPRQTSDQFLRFLGFLGEVISTQPQCGEIHGTLGNDRSHRTELVEAFLAEHDNVQIHITLTYSSWLNRVEHWVPRIQRDVISRGIPQRRHEHCSDSID
ncbi:transposase [Acidovorax sp.]|uniref:transposase n=1 Tax=Acidovorax sp. TaxID=1872122 RepID=UPI003D0231AB